MSDSTPVKKDAPQGAPEKLNGLTQRDLEILSKAWGAMKAQPEVRRFPSTFPSFTGVTPICFFTEVALSVTAMRPFLSSTPHSPTRAC